MKNKKYSYNNIIKVSLKTLKKSAFLMILLVLSIITMILLAYFNVFGFGVYFGFICTFILMSYIIFNLAYVFHHEMLSEYQVKPRFKKWLRLTTLFTTLFLVTLTGTFHLYFINNYINPPLETCSYYDLYGNNLIDFNTFSTNKCDIIQNESYVLDDTSNLKSLRFEVNTTAVKYRFEYVYENQKIIKKIKHEYPNNQLRLHYMNNRYYDTGILINHHSEELSYSYLDDSVIIHKKDISYNILTDEPLMKTFEKTTTISNINDETIYIKEENNYDIQLLDDIKNLFNDEYIELLKQNYDYYYANGFFLHRLNEVNLQSYIETQKERYKNNFKDSYDQAPISIKESEIQYKILGKKYSLSMDNDTIIKKIYSIDNQLDEEYTYKKLNNGLYVINDYQNVILSFKEPQAHANDDREYVDYYNNYRYDVDLNNNQYITKIDQYKQNNLIYRHLVTELPYGYQIEHYSYEKDGLKFKERNDYVSNDYCFNNNLNHIYVYGDLVNDIYTDRSYNGCGADLFYSNDLVFDYLFRS